MRQQVTIWYLEIDDPANLRPKRVTDPDVELTQACEPNPEFSRFLYLAVGGDLYWTERLPWGWEEWQRFLNRPELETWVLYVRGTPAGYFELERWGDGSAKILYFGLLPEFIGRGLGGHLLTAAIQRGFAIGNGRVWVHTCSLDTKEALPNYQARGLRIFREHTFERDLPDELPGPWPHAGRPVWHPGRG